MSKEREQYNKELKKELVEKLVSMLDKKNVDWETVCEKDGLADKFANSFNNTKQTQIRKFFNVIKTYKMKLDSGANELDIKAKLWQVVPQVVYKSKRKLVDKEFANFISKTIKRVTNYSNKEFREKFGVFLKIFESVVAYSKE